MYVYIVIHMASLIFCPGNLNMANPNGPNIAAKKVGVKQHGSRYVKIQRVEFHVALR